MLNLKVQLLLLLLQLAYSRTQDLDMEMSAVLHHDFDPEPERKNYIWNPFPGFCGPNATMVRCGGVCPETCAYKSRTCTTHCGVSCVCNQGYVFYEKFLKCILSIHCPQGLVQQEVETHRVFQ